MSCLFNSIQLPPPVRSLLFPCASTHSPLLPLPWVYNRVWARSGRVETRSCSKTIYLLHLLACLLFIPYHLLFCIFCILHSVQCTTAICGHFLFYFYLNYLTFFCFSFLDLSFFLSLSLSLFFFFFFFAYFFHRSSLFFILYYKVTEDTKRRTQDKNKHKACFNKLWLRWKLLSPCLTTSPAMLSGEWLLVAS